MDTSTQALILVVLFSLINIYFIADYLREITRAIRELTAAIKHEGLKQNVGLTNICSAIENKKREEKEKVEV